MHSWNFQCCGAKYSLIRKRVGGGSSFFSFAFSICGTKTLNSQDRSTVVATPVIPDLELFVYSLT